MKEKIHPNYGKCIVRCVCGETFETGSTKKELRVDICSKCHPFYTGKQKLVDTGGRVSRSASVSTNFRDSCFSRAITRDNRALLRQCPVFVCTFFALSSRILPSPR